MQPQKNKVYFQQKARVKANMRLVDTQDTLEGGRLE